MGGRKGTSRGVVRLAKIMVVDDAMFMRTKASRLLSQEGY